MGPSVKFVLPIIDAYPDQKNGDNFLCGKKGQTGGGAQCLEASTFSPFSKCFGNRFFCIFCKPYTYSHPFLTTLVSFKKIWPIYGYSHFWKPKNEQNWPQI